MKCKTVNGFEVYASQEGKIVIKQDSFEFGKPVCIFLTLDQFEKIENWVNEHGQDIHQIWNDGVENDFEA